MSATDRLKSERTFHDRQARERAATFAAGSRALAFTDEAYLSHETWIRPAFECLGDVRGRQVLDFGCGHGMAATVLARHGADVTAFDLSAGYLDEARRPAAANGVEVRFVRADAERLPFASQSFDRIWGNAVLHHLDTDVAARELVRVLRPGGVALFCEPWGGNPLLNWARKRCPYPGKERTIDEAPLTHRQIATLREHFPRMSSRGFQMLGMVRRILPRSRVMASLDWWDEMLLSRVPLLGPLCRYVVLTLPSPYNPPLGSARS